MSKYNVHAGHCPQNKGAYGAVGLLKESVENRIVKDEVIRLFRMLLCRRLRRRKKMERKEMCESHRRGDSQRVRGW